MGTGFSSLAMLEINGSSSTNGYPSPMSKPTGLGDLPENCVSSILNHMDPPEICKLATLSRAFHNASSADFIWESKLPPNYKFLVEKVLHFTPPNSYMPKKDIYTRLCQPNHFDGGTKVGPSFFFFLVKF